MRERSTTTPQSPGGDWLNTIRSSSGRVRCLRTSPSHPSSPVTLTSGQSGPTTTAAVTPKRVIASYMGFAATTSSYTVEPAMPPRHELSDQRRAEAIAVPINWLICVMPPVIAAGSLPALGRARRLVQMFHDYP